MNAYLWVVTFAPATEERAVGGFNWWTDENLSHAVKSYHQQVAQEMRDGDGLVIRLLHYQLDEAYRLDLEYFLRFPEEDHGQLCAQRITDYLDSDLDTLEMTGMALRQHVPANTDPDRLPDWVIPVRRTCPDCGRATQLPDGSFDCPADCPASGDH